jgi:hypothetical protein
MKITALWFYAKQIISFALILFFMSCSSHSDNAPGPQPTTAEILVRSGTWYTAGATLVQTDGTTLTLSSNDPFLKTILLYNVTFYADGTASDTNDPNGLTKNGLTWKLDGTHLLVRPNFNNTDKVDAIITSISNYTLVLKVTDFYDYNGVTYVGLIQTFGH